MLKITFAILLATVLLTCGQTVEESQNQEAEVEAYSTDTLEHILEIGGYDVAHLELYDDGLFDLPLQKMGPSHVAWLAALRCDTFLLRKTLEDGANPNLHMEGYWTVEEAAMCDNGVDLIRILEAHDVTIYRDLSETEDVENEPLVNIALVSGNLEVADYLLRNGSTLDERDQRYGLGCSAAQTARDSATLAFLIERGVDYTELCNFDRSLLHNAVQHGAHNFVDYLLKNKLIDPDIRDEDGDTAYDYAVYQEDQEMMDLLETYLLTN
ncbi:ankyrin repeat domain-containing protein [Lewinella sp. 4G2]|uniref:ankyrin repeat domain-containing protein n=1 Tax=Lewinella sp. 4G2 TaxID=1803372 RepID=UPI0007B48AAE|nr:ankyrin repeat domain-containing protein [Lewinella sp. 4G2]OAV44796.1 hypothetical protein A3850_009980 [Lewinella sp. 4G2]